MSWKDLRKRRILYYGSNFLWAYFVTYIIVPIWFLFKLYTIFIFNIYPLFTIKSLSNCNNYNSNICIEIFQTFFICLYWSWMIIWIFLLLVVLHRFYWLHFVALGYDIIHVAFKGPYESFSADKVVETIYKEYSNITCDIIICQLLQSRFGKDVSSIIIDYYHNFISEQDLTNNVGDNDKQNENQDEAKKLKLKRANGPGIVYKIVKVGPDSYQTALPDVDSDTAQDTNTTSFYHKRSLWRKKYCLC